MPFSRFTGAKLAPSRSYQTCRARRLDGVIEQDILERVLAGAVSGGADFAEVYAEDKRSTSAGLDDGRVEQVTSGRDRGAGIRVVAGDTTGFAYTSDLSEHGLESAASAAAAAASQGGGGVRTVALTASAPHRPNRVEQDPDTVAKATKVELLNRMDDAARSYGSEIVQVSAGYGDSRKKVLVANTDGVMTNDEIVRTLLRISAVADGDTGMQTGYQSMGHTIGFEVFNTVDVEELAREASRQAITKLSARPAPSGAMPVVIKHGTGGVLFHEACGHGLEADLIAKGASVYAGKVGQQVASPLVTLVDDGTMPGEWGTLGFDDEGHITQRNVLIEDGMLTDYMWDFLRARKEGRPQSGNGRRQSYQHLPMVRMTNTFVLDGPDDADDIIASTPNGVYVSKLGGGSVNTATGDFVFGMTEAYLIENGEITEPLRDGNLIGNGPKVLQDIDMLANDFSMGSPGTCGKDGQGVPVGDGQPTLRVKSLTIGGTSS
jgi:TldD protein